MKEYDYSYTDKVIKAMSKRFITLFNRQKRITDFDELNILSKSKKLYEELLKIAKEDLLLIAKHTSKNVGGNSSSYDKDWILDYLEEYDPITEYVFTHEVDRKQARYQESLIANDKHNENIDRALHLWDRMCRQYAIEVTDAVALNEYADNGVKKVQWITNIDGRECETCRERHKKIYDINNVPNKPHINCRCRIVPYE